MLLDKKKKILIAPLNWGLGHATRCIPIIRAQLREGNAVLIAADGAALALLQQHFPQCPCIVLKGSTVRYSKWMVLAMLLQIPKILTSIYREHQQLKKIIQEEHIDMVISDNRYGLWNKNIDSIFITHQIQIQAPAFEKLLFKINCYFINKYDECWVPDYEGTENLAGDLAHPKNEFYKKSFPKNLKYIGPLSRFEDTKIEALEKTYEALGIVSGPEPQRSLFEKHLVEKFKLLQGKCIIISGQPEIKKQSENDNTTLVSHLDDSEFATVLSQSKKIICRSGYSTIMDLHVLGLSAEFIATPGQTEQEYLARRMAEK